LKFSIFFLSAFRRHNWDSRGSSITDHNCENAATGYVHRTTVSTFLTFSGVILTCNWRMQWNFLDFFFWIICHYLFTDISPDLCNSNDNSLSFRFFKKKLNEIIIQMWRIINYMFNFHLNYGDLAYVNKISMVKMMSHFVDCTQKQCDYFYETFIYLLDKYLSFCILSN